MSARRAGLAVVLMVALLAGRAEATEAAHVIPSHAWIRVLPGDLPAGAYVVLENQGNQPATLRAASSPAYAEAMLHRSSTENGVSRMAMVDDLAIPAHGKVELSPGGYHLMLMKARTAVRPGDKVRLQLRFDDGSTLEVDFLARPANATGDTP
ncbi:copper chaperone PCu(A)C [Dyella sp. C9]|uniref:copper chaperone PCu(A)C n=1 Tax=Dyella sp. C9 TaxID=2202154 RepID=UPI000DEF2046|nr:copper chaperone PCu(A)C [Dyella sp. C9]